jgi:hypothetical protein
MDNQIVEYLGNVDFAKGGRFLIDGVEREELIATKLMILTRSISPDLARHVDQWAADRTTTLAGGEIILALDIFEHSYSSVK